MRIAERACPRKLLSSSTVTHFVLIVFTASARFRLSTRRESVLTLLRGDHHFHVGIFPFQCEKKKIDKKKRKENDRETIAGRLDLGSSIKLS